MSGPADRETKLPARSWLHAFPGPDTQLSSEEFREAIASSLCLPSPAFARRVGEVIRGRVKLAMVTTFRQHTLVETIGGGHDLIKLVIYQFCMWAVRPVEIEVSNLPQQGLAMVPG